MNPTDITLLFTLIDIGTKTAAAIKDIRDNKPDVYAHVQAHHAEALARAEAAAAGPT